MPISQKANKLIADAADNFQLTSKYFFTVRDYFLTTTLYENCSRPKPIENVTVGRFRQAKHTKPSGRWMIIVDKHKMTQHHGPAELTVDKHICSYFNIYLKYIYPKRTAEGDNGLFFKDDDQEFPPGTIGRRVSDFFTQAGVRKARKKDFGSKAPKKTSCTSEDTHAYPLENEESPKKHQDPAEDEIKYEGNDLISKEDSVKEWLSDDHKVLLILRVFGKQIDKVKC